MKYTRIPATWPPGKGVKRLAPAFHFFDSASTTPCIPEAADLVRHFCADSYGHPSSTHALGQQSARAIREARLFFGEIFQVAPEQIIFTGGGTESDNLAIYGLTVPYLASKHSSSVGTPRALASATEHPAVKKTILSLKDIAVDSLLIPVNEQGQIETEKLCSRLNPSTFLVSIHQANNITGAILPVEELAREVKKQVPGALFHTDAVQSFGKIRVPAAPSPVDLISISGHKVGGPKGIGALVVLNSKLLTSSRFRPMIWGGEQENGWRSGTQNAGLIAAFHYAAERTLRNMKASREHALLLQTRLKERLSAASPSVRWNSPESALPQIVSLSVPGFSAGPLARLLEERGFLVATGSACSSKKPEPDPTLTAMGLPEAVCTSSLRISFSRPNQAEHVDALVDALNDSISCMRRLGGGAL